MSWNTPQEVSDEWADAPLPGSGRLERMLAAAHEQCVAYAPTLAAGAAVPARYKEAELLQVRAIGQAQLRDNDVVGFGDGFAVRVRPLAADVKALLRPKRGKPVMG